MSNWRSHKVSAGAVMDMIDNRMNAIDMQFQYGQGKEDDKITKASYAEAKLQIAELKMIFVDLILEDKQGQLNHE